MRDPAAAVNAHLASDGEVWPHVRVRAVSGTEAISRAFAFEIELVGDREHDLPPRAIVGAEASLALELDGGVVRQVHGMIAAIRSRLEPTGDRSTHRLTLVPRAHRLALVETQEIFQDRSVPDILRAKLERHGFGAEDFELRLLRTYPAREFVVQFQESDWAFLGRLTEHLGIAFFFEHESGRDRLVFTDFAEGFRPVDDAEEVPFRGGGEARDVFALEVDQQLAPSSYVVQDYNHRMPRLETIAFFELESGNGGGLVDFGSHAKTVEEAAELASVRAGERLAQQRVYEGESAWIPLSAGRRVVLLDHPRLAGREPLLPIEVTHELTTPLFEQDAGGSARYRSRFRAVPGALAYRPPRRTPRPRISGVVTGVVQPGPGGTTGGVPQLDDQGRYTVQLHFDTAPPGELKASRPVRLAQPFAGIGHGMHFPLRTGTEVAVAFVNGDPDRPIILGALYNAESPSPVTARDAHLNRITTASGAAIEISGKR